MRERARTVVVVGGGHAGIEAALAAARVGARVVVVTASIDTIGQTPCNPSVGGVAKGHLVHEVVALGGLMGRAADACAIHGKILNLSKGPAVRSTRLQVDKARYGEFVRAVLRATPGLTIVEGMVERLELGVRGDARGVRLATGERIEGDAVVVTTGTFLGGLLHTGELRRAGGRVGEPPAVALSEQLRELGFRLRRLKTGTPPRLDGRTIDVARLELQGSDEPFPAFLPADAPDRPTALARVTCWITATNERTHELIRANLSRSPMYSGQITGVGPRYCPSIEDKVVRFADRTQHRLFLEPEGLATHSVYPNGISTSLPAEVQAALVGSIAGLERAAILVPGYAVEYDAVDARALTHELRSKAHRGLHFAGQINGTSGYEEAAIQGLIAGANAALSAFDRPTLQLERDRAYGGVLIDDLITQGCDEPYRMFTARAEYRLSLREDNADERLSAVAHEAGLIDAAQRERDLRRLAAVEACLAAGVEEDPRVPADVRAKARARRVYAGYLERQAREVERLRGGDGSLPLPTDLDYPSLAGLTRECVERLCLVRPTSTAQASRIPGITPAAVACLWAHARSRQLRA